MDQNDDAKKPNELQSKDSSQWASAMSLNVRWLKLTFDDVIELDLQKEFISRGRVIESPQITEPADEI